MRSRVTLQPPLSGDLTRLAFSPEAKYVLAQDPVNITVLSVQPFGPLFQVHAEAAAPAAFSPDSTMLVFSNATCRTMERLQIIDPSSGETLFGKAKFGASWELSLQTRTDGQPDRTELLGDAGSATIQFSPMEFIFWPALSLR